MSKLQSPPDKFADGWLSELDQRTAVAQAMRSRYIECTNDLGGADRLSYAQRSLVERSLWLEHWLREEERKLATGTGEFDVGRWVQAANSLQGIFAKLGLERKAKHVPDLGEFLRKRQQQEAR